MAEIFLNDSEIDPGLQEVGGKGMAQGMWMETSFLLMAAVTFARRKAPCTPSTDMGSSEVGPLIPPLPTAGKMSLLLRWVAQ